MTSSRALGTLYGAQLFESSLGRPRPPRRSRPMRSGTQSQDPPPRWNASWRGPHGAAVWMEHDCERVLPISAELFVKLLVVFFSSRE